MKPFNLRDAKNGKPVCTRDGRKARIICFDRDYVRPIVALVECPIAESVHYYFSNGKATNTKSQDDLDLMMLLEKKEGWVNVYKNPDTHNIYTCADVFESKEIAEEQGTSINRIATVKIEWEE